MERGFLINCHKDEENKECPDEEDSDPDSPYLIECTENRKGRFIIEDIEGQIDQRYGNDYNKYIKFNSFRTNKHNLNIEPVDLENENKLYSDNEIFVKDLSAYFLDYRTNTYVSCDDLFKLNNNIGGDIIYKYTELFNNSVNQYNFPDDIPDNDYAMIIQEETSEHEIDNENCSRKNYNVVENILEIEMKKKDTNDILIIHNAVDTQHTHNTNNTQNTYNTHNTINTYITSNTFNTKLIENDDHTLDSVRNFIDSNANARHKSSKNTRNNLNGCEKRYKSLEINFTNLNDKKFVSPACSPIQSPVNNFKKLNDFPSNFKNLYASTSFKVNENKKVKMIKNFIKTIEDSFNLEDKKFNIRCSSLSKLKRNRLNSVDITYKRLFKANTNPNQYSYENLEVKKIGFSMVSRFSSDNNQNSYIKNTHADLFIEHTISFSSINTDVSSSKNFKSICNSCLASSIYSHIEK